MVKEYPITEKNVIYELMRLESLSYFCELGDRERMEHIIAKACHPIVEWNYLLALEENISSFDYFTWKEMLLKKFCKEELTRGEVYRLKRKKDQSLGDFIEEVERKGRRVGIGFEERKEIIALSVHENAALLQIYIKDTEVFSEQMVEVLENMEKEFHEKRKIKTKIVDEKFDEKINQLVCKIKKEIENVKVENYKKKKKRKAKRTFYVESIGIDKKSVLNRYEKIKIKNKVMDVVLDTGACYNFVSYSVVQEIGEGFKRLHTPMYFKTCLEEEFYVKNYVDVDFYYEGNNYKERFYILPRVQILKILLGREFISKLKPIKMIGDNKLICHINTEPGKSVQEKTYPVSKAQEEGVSEAINELLEKKYIRTSNSTWINNMKPVIKPNGKYRITVNFVQLNKLVELDKYSLPKIEEMIYNLKGMSYFSKIDLKDGFFQVPLAEEDKYKTAFRFKHQLYEWNVMPMGYKNSPAIFQRVMDNALREEIGRSCFIYVDDILVFGKNEKEHDEGLERVLRLLKENKLEINEDKTILKIREAEFVGYIIKEDEIRPIIDDKEAIEKYSRPQNREEVQRFIGLVNYYRKFIPNCSTIAQPISYLLSTKVEFVWEEEQENAFNKLKEILLSDMVLEQPNFEQKFTLETDASAYGLGAILSQFNGEESHPIIFISRKLKPEELNYSISEKECLGALWAMEKLKYFLYGREFDLITDHQALEALNKGEIKSQRIERWFERLSIFNYTVKYKKGTEIPHVDALSRSLNNVVMENSTPCVNEIQVLDDDDDNISVEDKEKIIRNKHIKLVHRGYRVVLDALKEEYSWSDLNTLTKDVIKKCVECKKYNAKKNSKIKFVSCFKKGEKFAVDIIGPINKHYIISGIDYFTRRGFAKVIPSRAVKHVVKFLQEVYEVLPFETLILDQAKEFLSKDVANWSRLKEVTLHFTTPFHHQSNGRVERFNRTLQEGIFKSKKDESLKDVTARVVDVYNTVYHSGIGMSPVEAEKEENYEKVKEWMFKKRVEFNSTQEGKSNAYELKVGQPVLIRRETGLTKGKSRFNQKGIIYSILPHDTYKVLVDGVIFKRHYDQIKFLMDTG